MQGEHSLAGRMDDHALDAVPTGERRTWLDLTWNTAGIVTTLAILFFGALVSFVAGIRIALTAGAITFLFGTAIGWLLARVAVATGQSNTLITREHGLGRRGSALASLIFGLLIIGMLALENALLYEGVRFFLGFEDGPLARAAVYGLLTLAWIALTAFGFALVSRFSSLMLLAFLAVLGVVLARIFADSAVTPAEAMSYTSRLPADALAGMGIVTERDKLVFAINILIGPACALPLVAVDYSRYARSTLDAGLAVTLGNFVQVVVVTLLGGVIVYAAEAGLVRHYMQSGGLDATAAAARVLSSPYSIAAAFMLFGGAIGFVLMVVAQSKAQVLNCYGASLALTNLFDAAGGWRPGRFTFVVLANALGLAMIFGHLLELVEAWISMLGVLLASLSCLIVSDYYLARRLLARAGRAVPAGDFNLAGIASLALGILASQQVPADLLPVPALTAFVLVLVCYTPLRLVEAGLRARRR